jgi:tetratricopeptide (TPR) repeat protein
MARLLAFWVHKGDTQRAMKDYKASLQSYIGVLKIDKNRTAAWSRMAEAYTALEDYPKASVTAANATELEPRRKRTGSEKAIFYSKI